MHADYSNLLEIVTLLFAQARPQDYAKELLQLNAPISFHKFWHLDPWLVYRRWFYEQDRKLLPVAAAFAVAEPPSIPSKTTAARTRRAFYRPLDDLAAPEDLSERYQQTLPMQVPVSAVALPHDNHKHIDL